MQPPLLQAMQAYFRLPDAKLPVSLATLRNADRLTIFFLQNMPKPNYQAVDDVKGSLEMLGGLQSKTRYIDSRRDRGDQDGVGQCGRIRLLQRSSLDFVRPALGAYIPNACAAFLGFSLSCLHRR